MFTNLPRLPELLAYMPHGSCYLWQTPLVLLHVTSDFLIAASYFSIPSMLVYFVRKRQDTPFTQVFLLFGAFIAFCGLGHVLDIWTLWFPNYWVSGAERAGTAVISCLTALKLVEWMPQFLALRSPQELERLNQQLQAEIQARKQAQQTLQRLVEGTASDTGEAFFSALVQNLAQALGVNHACVAEYLPDHEQLQFLAVWEGEQAIAIDMVASLRDLPCYYTITMGSPYYITDSLQTEFPRATMFQQWQTNTYLGVPLLSHTGQALGVLCITHECALAQPTEAKAIMTIFAARASAEIQRQQAEQELRRAYGDLEQRVLDRTEELSQANIRLTALAQRERTTAQVIQRMRQSIDLDTIFASTIKAVQQALQCDRIFLSHH